MLKVAFTELRDFYASMTIEDTEDTGLRCEIKVCDVGVLHVNSPALHTHHNVGELVIFTLFYLLVLDRFF